MKLEKKCPVSSWKQGGTAKQKYDTNREAQCARLLSWLREKPITTLEARQHLDILAPAARVYDLKNEHNINIKTHWSNELTQPGVMHRVARYVLHPGKYNKEEIRNG